MKKTQRLAVLYETEDLVAVDKPAGLATIPGRAEATSVLEQLAGQLQIPASGTADPRLRVVHRLDKETSGVLLFAKNIAAQRHLSHQFQNNEVQKEYVAIVAGRPAEMAGSIEAAIAPHPTQKERMHVSKSGRPARTDWKVEQNFRRYTVLRCFPKTGKTHQIRVHLAHIGHRLAVDSLYSPQRASIAVSLNRAGPSGVYLSDFKSDYRPTRGEKERPLIARLSLHAHRLTFTPPQGPAVTIEAELPKDMRATINQLKRHGV